MSINLRLNKIESQVAALPPNGEALLLEMEQMAPERWNGWLRARTDAEIFSICEIDDGINWHLVTDAELEQMCAEGFDYETLRPELRAPFPIVDKLDGSPMGRK